jgi:hypothetical protein
MILIYCLILYLASLSRSLSTLPGISRAKQKAARRWNERQQKAALLVVDGRRNRLLLLDGIFGVGEYTPTESVFYPQNGLGKPKRCTK